MKKYLIVLKENNDHSFFEDYRLNDAKVHMNIIVSTLLDEELAEEISKDNRVVSIEKDKEEQADAEIQETPKYINSKTSYAFDFMNIGKFHDEGLRGQGFKIALLDTGIQKHTNLKVKDGINVYDSSAPWNENLANIHGTTVAGVLNAQGVNGELIGIIPDAELYCVTIDDGTGPINTTTWSSQIAGISWAVENGMDAVNCSFSSTEDSEARKTAFKLASDAGVAIFCSAGNTQPSGDSVTDNSRYPAKYPFTIANANIDSNKNRYYTSTVGRGINFANGGRLILTTTADKRSNEISDKHATSTGTSLATPATLGLYILYKQKYGETKEKILERMAINAEKLGNHREYGAGLPKYPTQDYINIQIKG